MNQLESSLISWLIKNGNPPFLKIHKMNFEDPTLMIIDIVMRRKTDRDRINAINRLNQ